MEPSSENLLLTLDGFEGPMDLLFDLARAQKVDLAKISILSLVDQYLAVIEGARRVRLELAADWLVMAAWLAWLKSRLLVPSPPEELEDGMMTCLKPTIATMPRRKPWDSLSRTTSVTTRRDIRRKSPVSCAKTDTRLTEALAKPPSRLSILAGF